MSEPVKYPLTIIYKNGVKIHAEAEMFKFQIDRSNRDFEWKNMWPKPLLLGVDEIIAIYQGHA